VSDSCVLCGIVGGRVPAAVVASSEHALAFLDTEPANEGHTLVIPKRHADDIWDLETEDGLAVWSLAVDVAHRIRSTLDPDGLTLSQANREAGGQDVFHFHLHVIPRFVRRWRPLREPGDLDGIAARLRGRSAT